MVTALPALEDGPALIELDETYTLERRQQTFDLIRQMEDAQAFTPVQLRLDGDVTYDQAEALAHFLGETKRRSSWYIGDLLIYAENAFGEAYAQIADATGLAEQTLLNLRYVCVHVPPDRRVAGLGFSLHAEVAKLSAKEQKAWLARALKGGWSRAELRERMKAKRKDEKPPLIDDDGNPVDMNSLVDAARALLRDATEHEDAQHYLVPNEDIARLKGALGEE